jgi:cyclopropane fatty-acyl-phospholipid synthase-like methyltransferase
MSNLMNEALVKNFFDAWSLYDKVLTYNYMFHEEIYRDVQHLIGVCYADRPFALLDLGCGSARHLARALEGSSICRYSGYDLSAMALDYAARNLASLGCPIDLHQGDLLVGLQASGEKVDLIFSSFALHHLVSTDKAVFFQLAYEGLSENGMLLLIDAMREEDEDHELYMDRYCGWLRSAWETMHPEELDAICDHIRNSDFPETASGLYAMATKAGFGKCIEINRFRWHHTLCFEKNHLLEAV